MIFETIARIDLPECLLDYFPVRMWFSALEIPVRVAVSDAERNPDSFLCNPIGEFLEVIHSETESERIKIGEFCEQAGITLNKLGDFCMTDAIRNESQHRFIYG